MTMKKKAIAYGFTAFMALAIFAAMMPTAAAQNPPITVSIKFGKPSEDLVKPEVGLVKVPIDVSLQIPPTSGCAVNIKLDHKATGPAYATAIMNPSGESFTYTSDGGAPFVSGGGETIVKKTELVVSTTRAAPAFENGNYDVTSVVSVSTGAQCAMSGGTGTGQVVLKNDYFPLIEALPQQTTLKSGQNSDVRFPIDITNFGNGQTRVSSEVAYTSEAKLDALIPPDNVIIESKAQQGTAAKDTKTVYVTARTPHNNGYTNSIYSFQVNMVGAYAGASPAGEPAKDEQSVALSLQVQGVYAPGFDPTMLIGALGVALLGIRRLGKVE